MNGRSAEATTALPAGNRAGAVVGRLVRPAGFPIHPALFAAYPVLLLFGENVGEVDWAELPFPLVASIAIAIVACALVFLVLRDRERAAILVTAGLIGFYSFGYVRDAVEPLGLGAGPLLLVYAIAAVIIAATVLRRSSGWARLNDLLTALGTVLVALSLVTIVSQGPMGLASEVGGIAAPTAGDRTTDRDIYYVILDRYPSKHGLRAYHEVEDSLLYRHLDELGFTVLADSQANYPRTLHSLASSLNMTYLDDVAASEGPQSRANGPLIELLQDHAVGRFLKGQGYTYVHLGSWWDPTETNRIADVNPRFEQGSDFLAALMETTALPDVTARLRRLGLPISGGPVDNYRRHYDASRFALDRLDDVVAVPGPKFVLLHILLPHDPYVFDRDGTFVTPQLRGSRSEAENFGAQLAFTDAQMIAFIESILAVPEEQRPIVILQADEGSNPARYDAEEGTFPWLEATDAELDEKFGILNALYLPGSVATAPAQDMSPVNEFRYVLGTYFGADLPLLPDRHFVFRDRDHPYDLIDVTDRVTEVRGGA